MEKFKQEGNMKVVILVFIFGCIFCNGCDAEEPEEFFTLIKKNDQIDLVLLIDR